MNQSDLFTCYDLCCRRAGLGGDGHDIHHRDGYTIQIGPWIYVAHWTAPSSLIKSIIQDLVCDAQLFQKSVIWRVYEQDQPDGLGDLLNAAGFQVLSDDALLVFDLSQPITPPHFDTIPVKSEERLAQYIRIVSEAFAEPLILSAQEKHVILNSTETLTFVSESDEGAMTAGQIDLSDGNPAVLLRGGSTLNSQRRKGGYASMVRARLRHAQAAGKAWAFVEARPTSGPILRHLGFRDLARGRAWVYTPSS